MAKHPFDPAAATGLQKMALDRLDAALEAVQEAETNLWNSIQNARDLKIPSTYLKEHTGIARTTMDRRRSGSSDGATDPAD